MQLAGQNAARLWSVLDEFKSVNLTTLDMRWFHSLIAVWAVIGAVLRRLVAAGIWPSSLDRAAELKFTPARCEAVVPASLPWGTSFPVENGHSLRTAHGFRSRIDTNDRTTCGSRWGSG